MRKQFTAKRLFRCRACGWRGWGDDFGPRFNSAELDAGAIKPRPSRTGIDIDELDGLHARRGAKQSEEPD